MMMKDIDMDMEELQYLEERAARKRRYQLRLKKERERKILTFFVFVIIFLFYSLFCVLKYNKEEEKILAITVEETPSVTNLSTKAEIVIPDDISNDISISVDVDVITSSPYKYDISEEEKTLFMEIMAAESYEYWSYQDILSLATVVINRYNAPENEFPNDFQEIFTQKNQFSTYSNGRYLTANITENCKQAVEDALQGKVNLNSDVKYFCTKEYYDSCPDNDFFKTLNHVYTVRNVYFFTE